MLRPYRKSVRLPDVILIAFLPQVRRQFRKERNVGQSPRGQAVPIVTFE